MLTAGIILMAAMMGAMFLFGHKMGSKHNNHASPEIAVSSSTAVSAPAAQNAPPAEKPNDAGHIH